MFRPKIELSDQPQTLSKSLKKRRSPPYFQIVAMVTLCLLPALAGWWAMCETKEATTSPCITHAKPRVVVTTQSKRLHLCRKGKSEAQFSVALGYAGVGKQREGDGRTPLGTYPLARARPSRSGLHRFLHIGYPTKAQRRAGLTGSAVGVHGPPRWAADLTTDLAIWGFTQGCVALARDEQVDQIAAWVSQHDVDEITIF